MHIQSIDIEEVMKISDDYDFKKLVRNKNDKERLLDNFILKAIEIFETFEVTNNKACFNTIEEFEWCINNNLAMTLLYRQLRPIFQSGGYPDVYYIRIKNVLFLIL